jgi:hypothetical protein
MKGKLDGFSLKADRKVFHEVQVQRFFLKDKLKGI